MPRVLHLAPAYFPRRGGIEVLLEESVDRLRDGFGWESAILTTKRGDERPDQCRIGNADVYSVPVFEDDTYRPGPRELAHLFSQVRGIVAHCRPKLIHAHWNTPLFAATMAVARTEGLPVILHVHGALDMPLPSRFLEKVRTHDTVIAVTEFVARSIRDRCNRTLPIQVIPNGLPFPELTPGRQKGFDLVMIGRLEPEKGFYEALVDLVPLLQERPSVRLAIAGQGEHRSELEKVVLREGIRNQVTLLGEVWRDEVLETIAEASVVVVPSLKTEGFGLVALEAAQRAVPVVASRVGGLPEVVSDGETGILVDPRAEGSIRAAVTLYLDDEGLRRRHGTSARLRSEQLFSLEEMVVKWVGAYSSVLSEQGETFIGE